MLTFKLLLSSVSFQFQSLSFKSSMVSLMTTRSCAYSNSLTTRLLPFSVITSTTIANNSGDSADPAPINSRLNVVVRSPAPLGLGRNGCWLSRGSQLPRALPNHFFAMLPPERPQKGSTQHLYNRSPVLTFSSLLPSFVSSFFFFSG